MTTTRRKPGHDALTPAERALCDQLERDIAAIRSRRAVVAAEADIAAAKERFSTAWNAIPPEDHSG